MSLPHLHFDIMISLLRGPQYGYSIREDISKLHNDTYKPSFGTLYVTLLKMMDTGMVKESPSPSNNTDERRKYYELTTEGRQTVHQEIRSREELNRKAQERLRNAADSQGLDLV